MKTLKDYITSLSTDMKSLETSLQEASLLDIEGTLGSGEEAIKDKIEKWITDNFKVTDLKISDNPNSDGKYEVSAKNVDVIVTNINNITSLTNEFFVWKEIKWSFNCARCYNLTSLEGAPREVGGGFDCSRCYNLTSLEGAPNKIGENFNCIYCKSLKSLEGAPKEVGSCFYCSNCKSLKSLEGAPKKVDGNFHCSDCDSLTSLKYAPEKVGGNFKCSFCPSLTSLKGAPKEVGGDFDCYSCDNLKSRDLPATTKIKGNIY